MQLVNDLSHYSQLVGSRKRWPYTNCYLLPDSVRSYIENGQMRVSLMKKGIIFLCKENDFDYLYYFLDDLTFNEAQLSTILPSSPVVVDLLYRGEQVPESILDAIRFWHAAGFVQNAQYRHMQHSRSIDKTDENGPMELPENFSVVIPEESFFQEIDHILRTYLDIYSSPLPTINEMKLMSKEGNLCALIENGTKVAGVLCSKNIGRLNTILKVAIVPEYRNRGFADLFVKENIARSKSARIFDLWVKTGNFPAIRLYEKNGYRFDGKHITQFLKP